MMNWNFKCMYFLNILLLNLTFVTAWKIMDNVSCPSIWTIVSLKPSIQMSKMENKSNKLDRGHFNIKHKFLPSVYTGERGKISEQGTRKIQGSNILEKKRHRLKTHFWFSNWFSGKRFCRWKTHPWIINGVSRVKKYDRNWQYSIATLLCINKQKH